MGWLADKAFDAGVAMTTKELLWDVESASELRRAMILAIAQKLRAELFDTPVLPAAALERPEDFGRPGIGQYYWNLETVRNEAVAQQEQLQRNLPKLGMALPQFALDHMKNSRRALELWMVSLGCVVHTKSRPDVVKVWNLLRSAFALLPDAFEELTRVEALTVEVSGAAGPLEFALTDRLDWLNACGFLPPFLASR